LTNIMKRLRMRLSDRLFIFCVGLIFFGLMTACSNESQNEVEFKQSYDSGKAYYEDECQKCHKENGEGLSMLYPPLANSDYLKTNETQLVCIIYKGLKGPIVVNGKKYNWPMPAHQKIDEIQMSSILTYIQSTWGNTQRRVDFKQARAMMDACGN